MDNGTLGKLFLAELKAETGSSRKCLERIPDKLFGWKPHERSMTMGNLATLVADMPRWIANVIDKSIIDFATYGQFKPKDTAELIKQFDKNVEGVEKVLQKVSNKELSELFYLKNNGTTLFSAPKDETVSSTINHWVHHRGQLTVYMRLNDIPVPSIYGPSADEKTF